MKDKETKLPDKIGETETREKETKGDPASINTHTQFHSSTHIKYWPSWSRMKDTRGHRTTQGQKEIAMSQQVCYISGRCSHLVIPNVAYCSLQRTRSSVFTSEIVDWEFRLSPTPNSLEFSCCAAPKCPKDWSIVAITSPLFSAESLVGFLFWAVLFSSIFVWGFISKCIITDTLVFMVYHNMSQ